ncbi:hypothetical protein GCM10009617_12870 [Leifsonia poae]|uniref:PASTA domain-containing protein n=2 Tax=Leifsonia poae TaxID=110933 RepID=A0A9W6M0H7_9MICO|nr:hypothetical protein GCM10017584_25090 [Leifsonia poae]
MHGPGLHGPMLMRTARFALVVALAVAGLTACETVAPPTSDTTAAALIDVVGKPSDLAAKLLRGADYQVVVHNAEGDAVALSPKRLVTAQSPVGGTKLNPGRTVIITVGD